MTPTHPLYPYRPHIRHLGCVKVTIPKKLGEMSPERLTYPQPSFLSARVRRIRRGEGENHAAYRSCLRSAFVRDPRLPRRGATIQLDPTLASDDPVDAGRRAAAVGSAAAAAISADAERSPEPPLGRCRRAPHRALAPCNGARTS